MQRQPIAVLTVIIVAVLLATTVSYPGKIESQQTGNSSGIANAQSAKVLTNSNGLGEPSQVAALSAIAISALNKEGLEELVDAVAKKV